MEMSYSTVFLCRSMLYNQHFPIVVLLFLVLTINIMEFFADCLDSRPPVSALFLINESSMAMPLLFGFMCLIVGCCVVFGNEAER